MKRFHANVGSRNPALQQRPEILHAISVYAAIYVLNRMVNDLMSIVSFESTIGYPFVAVERSPSLNMLLDFRLNGFHLAVPHHLRADTSTTFQHSEDYGLIRPASASDALFALAEMHVPSLP